MNPYYYFFYKLTRFLNKKGNNEWGVIFAISGLVGWNFVIAYVKTFNITQEESEGVYKVILIVIGILLFSTNALLFTNKHRVEKILKRYQNESVVQKKLGSIAVLLYAILTISLIIFA
ncbi:MAG: hypothetical protein PF694_01380 [Bacteroidetes bacterium]|jgi:hypothetical protein|nr:hypothetical protein [Bacteroidota bacterium]